MKRRQFLKSTVAVPALALPTLSTATAAESKIPIAILKHGAPFKLQARKPIDFLSVVGEDLIKEACNVDSKGCHDTRDRIAELCSPLVFDNLPHYHGCEDDLCLINPDDYMESGYFATGIYQDIAVNSLKDPRYINYAFNVLLDKLRHKLVFFNNRSVMNITNENNSIRHMGYLPSHISQSQTHYSRTWTRHQTMTFSATALIA